MRALFLKIKGLLVFIGRALNTPPWPEVPILGEDFWAPLTEAKRGPLRKAKDRRQVLPNL